MSNSSYDFYRNNLSMDVRRGLSTADVEQIRRYAYARQMASEQYPQSGYSRENAVAYQRAVKSVFEERRPSARVDNPLEYWYTRR